MVTSVALISRASSLSAFLCKQGEPLTPNLGQQELKTEALPCKHRGVQGKVLPKCPVQDGASLHPPFPFCASVSVCARVDTWP